MQACSWRKLIGAGEVRTVRTFAGGVARSCAGCGRSTRRRYSGVRLTGRITGLFEEVPAFVGAEQGADVAEGGPERLEGARGRLAQERFDLGERHLDRVQIGRVLGEEQEPGAPRLERLCGASAFVDREIVRDHDIAGPKGRKRCSVF